MFQLDPSILNGMVRFIRFSLVDSSIYSPYHSSGRFFGLAGFEVCVSSDSFSSGISLLSRILVNRSGFYHPEPYVSAWLPSFTYFLGSWLLSWTLCIVWAFVCSGTWMFGSSWVSLWYSLFRLRTIFPGLSFSRDSFNFEKSNLVPLKSPCIWV